MSGASITANTIPTSAINGGISVSLPTTTMTARTSTQIGYQISQTFGENCGNYDAKTHASITLTPAGSVWIVAFQANFLSNNNNLQMIELNAQENSGSWESGKYQPGNHICGFIDFGSAGGGANIANITYAKSFAISNVYVVSTTNQSIKLGSRCGTTGSGFSISGNFRATRIA
jgi:hypothetical protein